MKNSEVSDIPRLRRGFAQVPGQAFGLAEKIIFLLFFGADFSPSAKNDSGLSAGG